MTHIRPCGHGIPVILDPSGHLRSPSERLRVPGDMAFPLLPRGTDLRGILRWLLNAAIHILGDRRLLASDEGHLRASYSRHVVLCAGRRTWQW